MMRYRFLAPITVCAGALLALLPAAASADGMTLTVGTTAHLVAGVEVDVPITVSCAPLPPPSSGTVFVMSLVLVEEAVGKSIAHGQGFVPEVPCDGASHTATSAVIADTSSPPFKRGQAVVTAAFADFCVNTSTGGVCDSAGSAPVTIAIRR
jgi:hypothetical protein